MKTITIKQPWASLIIDDIKDIENRTWPTRFRGRVLVHAGLCKWTCDKRFNLLCETFTTGQFDYLDNNNQFITIIYGAIIGSVEIIDCVINHPSIWAEKTEVLTDEDGFPVYGEKTYNWVLANPIKFPEPIPAKGKLSFWDYPNILAEQEEKDGELFCHCQLSINEENQVYLMIDHYRCHYCGGKWYK